MTVERRFEINGESDGKKTEGDTGKAAPPGQTTPTAPLPRVSERKRTAERPARRPRSRARAAKTTGKEPPAGLVFPFTPGFLLFVGAVVLGLLWAGGLFAPVEVWPWELFRSDGEGALTFAGDGPHVLTLLGAGIVVFLLIASLVPSSRGRGRAVLVVAALALVPFAPGARPVLVVGAAMLGVLGGAVIARAGTGGGRGAVFLALVVLAATLFWPAGIGETYTSAAWDTGQAVLGEAGDASLGEVLATPRHALVIVLVLLVVLGLLCWLGLGGRWAFWTGGVLLGLGVLAPLVLTYLEVTGEVEALSAEASLRLLAQGLDARVTAFLALALPVGAGVLDSARRAPG